MRTLVILRGSPASGKSTWVEEQGLENYTLSADKIRLLVESPILVADKRHEVISQENDTYVWQLLFELLEKRMQRGEFVVIDATHSRSTDFSRYDKLCERYRYRKYYVDFSDVPLEECKRRNAERAPYKRVPENVIEKMYARLETQSKTSGWKQIDRNNFWDEICMRILDFNKYKKVHIFGDIHGCYEPLKEYFEKNPYNNEDMYIFVGDYIDRGIQNKEVLEFLIQLSKKNNVLLLEGNHERWLKYYALDETEEFENIHSKEFLKNTIPQIIDMDKADLRNFYRKLGQIAYFEYDKKIYIVSHGGLSYIPIELQLVSTEQFIKGVGSYQTNIDEIFTQNAETNKIIQVHGHRNTFEIDNTKQSYNLEGKVEFGGDLRVLQLQQGEEPVMVKIKNNVYSQEGAEEDTKTTTEETKQETSIIKLLRNSRDIEEREQGNNISSFNFTRDAFYKKHWNDITVKARGLFIDTDKEKVVARGYNKFFNINERRETHLEHLMIKFKDKKITCYKKENGFLGLLSFVNGELFFATKSSNKNEYVEYFKEIYNSLDINKDKLIDYLKNNDVTLTFEVIDVKNDPHIIKYNKSNIILLDIIQNDFEFKKEPYEEVQRLAKEINCECKTIYKEFVDVREFHRWYLENTNEDNLAHEDIEGVVIECEGIMTKLKFPYYNFWKFMRGVKEKVIKRHQIKLSTLYNAKSNYFYAWLKEQDNKILQQDIITLREMFEKNMRG